MIEFPQFLIETKKKNIEKLFIINNWFEEAVVLV